MFQMDTTQCFDKISFNYYMNKMKMDMFSNSIQKHFFLINLKHGLYIYPTKGRFHLQGRKL